MSEVPLFRCRGTSLTREGTPLRPCRRPMPKVLGVSEGVVRFFMGEVPLYNGDLGRQLDAAPPHFSIHSFRKEESAMLGSPH